MQMTPEARRALDDIVRRILARHALSDPERAGVHYELMSHIHSAAEQKAGAAGRATIEPGDIQAALFDAGGEEELARAFVLPFAKPVERVLFWRRLGALVIDALLLGIATTFVRGVLYLVMAPALRGQVYTSDPFDVSFPWDLPFSGHEASGPAFAFAALATLASGALILGYFAWLEANEGRSLGKRALGLRVVRVDGKPMTYRESIIRNLVKLVPPLLVLDTLVMLIAFRDEKQRVSDKIAETAVVRA